MRRGEAGSHVIPLSHVGVEAMNQHDVASAAFEPIVETDGTDAVRCGERRGNGCEDGKRERRHHARPPPGCGAQNPVTAVMRPVASKVNTLVPLPRCWPSGETATQSASAVPWH